LLKKIQVLAVKNCHWWNLWWFKKLLKLRMSKTVWYKKILTVDIAVRLEKKLLALKNRFKVYFYFEKCYHILTIKNYHIIYHFLW